MTGCTLGFSHYCELQFLHSNHYTLAMLLSVTRYGEISPLWQKFNQFLAIFSEILNLFWQSFNAIRHIFINVNGQILEKLTNHLVSLMLL